jgi:alanyl-tRNA synthetase
VLGNLIDQGEALQGGPPGSPDQDGDRFLEFWNLVFMQYEQLAPGERVDLPKPSIDTGMGLERIAAVLQGVHSNYDTDLFRTLIAAVAEATGAPYDGAAKASTASSPTTARCVLSVADGVLPSNEGRGYVLRRIMRRAMRHAQLLGARDPVMHRLVQRWSRDGPAYPELVRAEALIAETLEARGNPFRRNPGAGPRDLDEETKNLSPAKSCPARLPSLFPTLLGSRSTSPRTP